MKKLLIILSLFVSVAFAGAEEIESPFAKLFGDALLRDVDGKPLVAVRT